MNFDDKFTKDFEEKFQKHLQTIRGISPESFEKIKQNLQFVLQFLEDLKTSRIKHTKILKSWLL